MRARVGILALALGLAVAVPAMAQGIHGGEKRHRTAEDPANDKKKKADDAAYKAALQKTPAAKTKTDPWDAMR